MSMQAQAETVPADYAWSETVSAARPRGTPATAVDPKGSYMLMKNLWYNNGRCALLLVQPRQVSAAQCCQPVSVRAGQL